MAEYKVWHRAEGQTLQSSGTLTVEPGKVAFEGKKDSFTIAPPLSVSRKQIGMTNWVSVQFTDGGEARTALFVDRRMLGWGGILGGNQKLAEDLASI